MSPPAPPPLTTGKNAESLEAIVELLYLAASADDEFSDDERAHFKSSVESLTDRKVDDLDALVAKVEAAAKAEGVDARLASVKARLPDVRAREAALAMAIRLTAVDGIVRTSEREWILSAAEALDIDTDTAADMVSRAAP
jgi:uncharacterized tellurite resistance protein B-like protein